MKYRSAHRNLQTIPFTPDFYWDGKTYASLDWLISCWGVAPPVWWLLSVTQFVTLGYDTFDCVFCIDKDVDFVWVWSTRMKFSYFGDDEWLICNFTIKYQISSSKLTRFYWEIYSHICRTKSHQEWANRVGGSKTAMAPLFDKPLGKSFKKYQ